MVSPLQTEKILLRCRRRRVVVVVGGGGGRDGSSGQGRTRTFDSTSVYHTYMCITYTLERR